MLTNVIVSQFTGFCTDFRHLLDKKKYLLLVTTADPATFKNMGRELLKMFAFGFPFDVLMNNLVENNNIITCY